MKSFLKNFLNGEKSPEEKAILATQEADKKHDILTVEECTDDEECEEEQENFSGPCCGGGCRG